jgi:molybdate transport system regulatory protein
VQPYPPYRLSAPLSISPGRPFSAPRPGDKLAEMSAPDSPQPPAAPGPSATPTLKPRVKVWFEAPGGYSFGYGLIAILQAVAQAGSIKQAARDLGQSYRHVWGRIKEAEQAIATPLVVSQVGGQGPQRTELTDTAHRLIADFLALRGRMVEVMEREYARRDDTPAPP